MFEQGWEYQSEADNVSERSNEVEKVVEEWRRKYQSDAENLR